MSAFGGNGDEVRAAHEFPTTRWSLVGRAAGVAGAGTTTRRDALGDLLTRYLPALRAHLLARRVPGDRVDDLLQSFIADKVLERDLLAVATQTRGRFRAFLVTALNRHAANQFRHDAAGKRSPTSAGSKLLSLDAERAAEPAAKPTSDAFDVAWAREVLRQALARTRADCITAGRPDLWDILNRRILEPAIHGTPPAPYAELVARHGYATPKQAANALITAKRRFEHVLRDLVAEYVLDEDELEEELAGLGAALEAAAHLSRPPDATGMSLLTAGLPGVGPGFGT